MEGGGGGFAKMREFNLNAIGPREMPRESFINSKRPPRKTAKKSNNCQKSPTAKRIRRYGSHATEHRFRNMAIHSYQCSTSTAVATSRPIQTPGGQCYRIHYVVYFQKPTTGFDYVTNSVHTTAHMSLALVLPGSSNRGLQSAAA